MSIFLWDVNGPTQEKLIFLETLTEIINKIKKHIGVANYENFDKMMMIRKGNKGGPILNLKAKTNKYTGNIIASFNMRDQQYKEQSVYEMINRRHKGMFTFQVESVYFGSNGARSGDPLLQLRLIQGTLCEDFINHSFKPMYTHYIHPGKDKNRI